MRQYDDENRKWRNRQTKEKLLQDDQETLRGALEFEKQQKEDREKALTESAININIAQTKFVGDQAAALEEQRKFSRIIKNSSLAMAWATGVIAFMTFAQVVMTYFMLTKEPEKPVIVRQLPVEVQPEIAPTPKLLGTQAPSHPPSDSGTTSHTSRNP